MAIAQETMSKFRQFDRKARQTIDALPLNSKPDIREIEASILHAGAETLQLIDRLLQGEKVQLAGITDTEEHLEGYIQRVVDRHSDPQAAGQYVIIDVDRHRFLGISQLAQRDLTNDELRNIYGNHSDEVLTQAKRANKLPLTTDLGVQISFSTLPLHAIQEVNQIGTREAKLAAHITATGLTTAPESLHIIKKELQEHCHDENPQGSLGDTHIMTPFAIALTAATSTEQLDAVLRSTVNTTTQVHHTDNPTLAQTMHMHHLSPDLAQQQTSAISKTGLVGGVQEFQVIFWLQGWDGTVAGINQAELRKKFQVQEVLPISSLAVSRNLADLDQSTKLGLTVSAGLAVTATQPEQLERQLAKATNPTNLSTPIRQLYRK